MAEFDAVPMQPLGTEYEATPPSPVLEFPPIADGPQVVLCIVNRATHKITKETTTWLSYAEQDLTMTFHPATPNPIDYEDFAISTRVCQIVE